MGLQVRNSNRVWPGGTAGPGCGPQKLPAAAAEQRCQTNTEQDTDNDQNNDDDQNRVPSFAGYAAGLKVVGQCYCLIHPGM